MYFIRNMFSHLLDKLYDFYKLVNFVNEHLILTYHEIYLIIFFSY